MKYLFFPILVLVGIVSLDAKAWQDSHLTPEAHPRRLEGSPLTAGQSFDPFCHSQGQVFQENPSEQSPTAQPNAPTKLRLSFLTQQRTGLLSRPGQGTGLPTGAHPVETPPTVPDGWFKKTAFAWSVGDYNQVVDQIRTTLKMNWLCWLWAAVVSAILWRDRANEYKVKPVR